jgi:putative radical SAM enzyme (TIGR03279 family)
MPERVVVSALVQSVVEESDAWDAGIRAGDAILSINGHELRDVIDYQFHSADEYLDIALDRDGEVIELSIDREYSTDLGIEFAAPTFDGIRRCDCRCAFCFVRQMPPGLRRSLYVHDDDYRYSFLYGSFVTLTNLDKHDWDRLAEQRLSPLYISVHATDPEVRRRLLGHPGAPDVTEQIEALGSMGIQVHAQIVLVPGVNDGLVLSRTVRDLASLRPTVLSVAIVPVGLTRFHRRGVRPVSRDLAAQVVGSASRWQASFREDGESGFVHASDELYLASECEVPAAEAYDGFPHLENGVGQVRNLLDDWQQFRSEGTTRRASYAHAAVVCGELIAPVMGPLLDQLSTELGIRYDLYPVRNRFFGGSVTVSGLLTGKDVVSALRRRELGEVVILPRSMFDQMGQHTLDEMTGAEIATALRIPVRQARHLSELPFLSPTMGEATTRQSP